MTDPLNGAVPLNYESILNDVTIPSSIRLLAMKLMQETYINPGVFFEHLSDADLFALHDIVERQFVLERQESTEPIIVDGSEYILLLGMMLASAEGTLETTEENADFVYSMTGRFLTIESLYRKGLIDVFREGFSYTDLEIPIAKIRY